MRILDTDDNSVVPANTPIASKAAKRVDFREKAVSIDLQIEANEAVALRESCGTKAFGSSGCHGNRRSPARSRRKSGAHITNSMMPTCNEMARCSPCLAVITPITEPPMMEPK